MNDWVPRSPCGPGCTRVPAATVPAARAWLRLVLLVGTLLGAVPVLLVGRQPLVRRVFRLVLRAAGVRLRVVGGPVPAGALVVTNHVSWLDTPVLCAARPMPALAKREVGEWPVIGRLVRRAGTVFLDRERLRSLPGTVSAVSALLRAGRPVHVCPEGTTWCGRAVGRFRPALFQAAIDADVPVVPVALRYLIEERATPWPAFVGPDPLAVAVLRTLRLRGLVAEVRVLPAIPTALSTRGELAARAERVIRMMVEPVAAADAMSSGITH